MDKCKYCKHQLEEVECAKYDEYEECDFSFHEVIGFVYWILSFVLSSYKIKLNEHKYKITCINIDCIGYLAGCVIQKRSNFSWSYSNKKQL